MRWMGIDIVWCGSGSIWEVKGTTSLSWTKLDYIPLLSTCCKEFKLKNIFCFQRDRCFLTSRYFCCCACLFCYTYTISFVKSIDFRIAYSDINEHRITWYEYLPSIIILHTKRNKTLFLSLNFDFFQTYNFLSNRMNERRILVIKHKDESFFHSSSHFFS